MMRLKQMALPSRAVLVLLLGLLVGLSVVVAGVSTHARAHPASIITVSRPIFNVRATRGKIAILLEAFFLSCPLS